MSHPEKNCIREIENVEVWFAARETRTYNDFAHLDGSVFIDSEALEKACATEGRTHIAFELGCNVPEPE